MTELFHFSPEELRCIILGTAIIRKCYNCEEGLVYYTWNDDETISTDIPQSQYEESNPKHCYETCEHCQGVGFQIIDFPI